MHMQGEDPCGREQGSADNQRILLKPPASLLSVPL
jgi:hypothetical protein